MIGARARPAYVGRVHGRGVSRGHGQELASLKGKVARLVTQVVQRCPFYRPATDAHSCRVRLLGRQPGPVRFDRGHHLPCAPLAAVGQMVIRIAQASGIAAYQLQQFVARYAEAGGCAVGERGRRHAGDELVGGLLVFVQFDLEETQ